ncbi:MAG TPA: DUF4349 domain-containing protein [Telluria sp.]|jgi:hypothetical protein
MKHVNTLTRTALCIALMTLLASCAKKEQAPGGVMLEERTAAAPAMDAAMAPPPPPAVEGKATGVDNAVTSATTAQQMGSSAATYTDNERKFIRTAAARFLVKDVYVSALNIEDTVAGHGGFVVRNDIASQTVNAQQHAIGNGKLAVMRAYTVEGNLIVRVPSAKTQEFLRAIAGHIAFLDKRNFAAHDAQFDLLRQQLEMMRSQETQGELGEAVRDGGKLAHKTEAIAARNEVKAERDGALLAKKEFEDKVAFSTIELQLYQTPKVLQTEETDVQRVFRDAGPGFFTRLGEKLHSGWDGLQEFALWLAGIWPVVLIGAVIGSVLWRLRGKRRKQQKPD